MSRASYQYTKLVLKKVSFNPSLFEKELFKAIRKLLPFEVNELFIWLSHFTNNNDELYDIVLKVKPLVLPVNR